MTNKKLHSLTKQVNRMLLTQKKNTSSMPFCINYFISFLISYNKQY